MKGGDSHELDYLRLNAMQNKGVLFDKKALSVSFQLTCGPSSLQGQILVANKFQEAFWTEMSYDLQDGVELVGSPGSGG